MIDAICRDCGARYPLSEGHTCSKRPTKKPDRVEIAEDGKDVRAPRKSTGSHVDEGRQVEILREPAGTQAPPVDNGIRSDVTIWPVTTRGTPRQRAPKGTFDRKAYQRVKAKERRDRRRTEKDGGNAS